MDHFRTLVPLAPSGVAIVHTDKLLCIGSCFAEQIGGRLAQLKFSVCLNPFGIVHNPISLARSLEQLIGTDGYASDDLFENLGLWHSFDHHGRFSHPDKGAALREINHSLEQARHFLKNTNRLLLTLGTAIVFQHKQAGNIVANCHKVPSQAFVRRRISVEEVVTALLPVLQKLKAALPMLEVVATVSPVRHLRDGLVENQRSKATLLLGLESVCRELPFVRYFPAYELLLDDLRDYRFYANDLFHPNELAIGYIWQYFSDTFFDEKTKSLCRRIAALHTAMAHRPFHPASEAHQFFLKNQLLELKQLAGEFSGMDFSHETTWFEEQLSGHTGGAPVGGQVAGEKP